MKSKIEQTLNLLPEVHWDRWTGELDAELGIGVFGWVARQDGKSDFVYLRVDKDGAWMVGTSSAEHSAEFARRLKFDTGGEGHKPCKRVEDYFPNVKAIRLHVVKG